MGRVASSEERGDGSAACLSPDRRVRLLPLSRGARTMEVGHGAQADRDPRNCEYRRADGSLCNGWKARGGAYCAGHAGLGFGGTPAAASRIGQPDQPR
jgi:hypothetical protein